MDFLTALKAQIESRKSRRGKLLLKRLDRMAPKRRARVLARMEEEARLHLTDSGFTVGDDWGAVKERDWSKFFESLLAFLVKILPLILPLFI